jgi:hypothetical protein
MDEGKVETSAGKLAAATATGSFGIGLGGLTGPAAIAWLAAIIPIAWGIWNTLGSVAKIFQ